MSVRNRKNDARIGAETDAEESIFFGNLLSHGMFLSATCAEDVRFITEEDIRAATEGTFLGDYRVRRQQAAGRIWPVGEGIEDDFQRPLTSAAPVLVISGDADVATPASDGERVVRELPNGTHVVFPHQGHALANPSCASRLISDFIAAARGERLALGCVAETRAPVFRDRR